MLLYAAGISTALFCFFLVGFCSKYLLSLAKIAGMFFSGLPSGLPNYF
jgi:hypothetical protein